MKIFRGFSLLMVIACLVVLGIATAWSQTDFNIKIYAADGSGWVDSVIIGRYVAAANTLDDSLSPTLVEAELPPLPVGGSEQAADLRIVDPTQAPPAGPYGQGVGVDLRHLVSDGQKDVYRLNFRRSSEGTGMTLSWPENLGSIGGGGFYLTDGDFDGFYFDPVDMTVDSSINLGFPFTELAGGAVDIIIGDGSMMRTFLPDSIALSEDSKGKLGKYQKRKPIANEFHLEINAPGSGASLLHMEFSMVSEGTVSFPGNGHAPINFSGLKKYDWAFVPDLDPGQLVVIDAIGNKGKPVKGTYWFNDKSGKTAWLPNYEALRMPFPNINNIGDEIYLQGSNLQIGLTAATGTTEKGKPIIRNILVPKWKDVSKTLWKLKKPTVFLMTHGDADCLDTIKGKELIKSLKSIDPLKYIHYKGDANYGNPLVAQMLALKFNIAISAKGKTPAQGFGELVYTNDGHPYDGWTVNAIATNGDSVVSCTDALPAGWSFQDFADFIETLNAEFSGPFDTLAFGGPADGKPLGGTVATGIKPVLLSDIFVGSGATFAPVAAADYSELYDVPEVFELSQNYPNPFNPTTTIEFTLPEDAFVTLTVYNMLGQEVARLADREEFTAGQNRLDLDGATLATGIYYYRISVNDNQFQEVRKMVLMK